MEFTLLWVNLAVQCDKWTGTMQDCRRIPAEGPTRPAVTLPTVTAVKKRPNRLIQFKLVNLLIRPILVLQILRRHIQPLTGYPLADTAGCSGQPQPLRCLFNNNNNNSNRLALTFTDQIKISCMIFFHAFIGCFNKVWHFTITLQKCSLATIWLRFHQSVNNAEDS